MKGMTRRASFQKAVPLKRNKNQPKESDFTQQRIYSIAPRVTEFRSIIILLIIGIIFTPLGSHIANMNDDVYQTTATYDGDGQVTDQCQINTANVHKQCTFKMTITEDITGPLYLYYELQNFYQNHNRYVSSKSYSQLSGSNMEYDDVKLECDPLVRINNTKLLNPCGLVANTMFNDIITATFTDSSNVVYTLDESDIALPSDKDKYDQVDGFDYYEKTTGTSCKSGYTDYTDGNTDYCYYYPNDETTQYLYQTYGSDIISPIDGVNNEHFIVWMRVEALPTFRKLYGKIDYDFKSGDEITISITNNFEVQSFDGTKSIILTTVGNYGGKNPFPGVAFIITGAICFFLGVFLLIKNVYVKFLKK
jgi:hypothetical protein